MDNRDLEYERENTVASEQYPEGEIKCKNHKFCAGLLPLWWYECKGCYFCTNCASFGWRELEFKEATNEECVVCQEEKVMMKFPANCGHWLCLDCCRKILFWDETRYHLSQVQFGAPPCPKGCLNPIRGRQCSCLEYDAVLEKWRADYPDQFEEHLDAESLSTDLGETDPGSVFNSQKCPLCREVYGSGEDDDDI